jgi:hypothetical protein
MPPCRAFERGDLRAEVSVGSWAGSKAVTARPYENQHRPHCFLYGAAPLKPLPEPIELEHYRLRRQARVGNLINEYRLVA